MVKLFNTPLAYFTAVILLSLASCNPVEKGADGKVGADIISFPEKAKGMNIYEVNIRQYTPEGTINAFADHIPRLKKMGVDILWIMPVQPISEKNRKGSLGSYYSIQDYTAINPDFGSDADFRDLVERAHRNEMVVILDWVANHTGFDHEWTEIDGYHNTDSLGNVTWPADTDWTDVADLNYDNKEMRQSMISEMKWWITEMDIDGFRCDVAGMVPNDFWSAALDSLKVTKDIFMLAEWDEPKMHDAGFHMTYGWGPHHWMNSAAKGEFDVDSLETLLLSDIKRYDNEDFRMMFTTNHDENSWNGTVHERFGEGHLTWAAWAFTARGMPLIYSGQEAGLNKRLKFFEKDTIDWTNVLHEDFYSKLLNLKHDNKAIHNGNYGGQTVFIDDSNSAVSTFIRKKDAHSFIGIFNLSNEKQEILLSTADTVGEFEDLMTKEKITIEPNSTLSLAPFQYYLFSID